MSGSDGGAWFANLCDEAGEEGSSPGGTAAGRQVRQRDLAVRPRLFDPAPTSEDRGGGAHHDRAPGSAGKDGTGARRKKSLHTFSV